MKRVLSLVLALVLTLTLAACGDSSAEWQEQYDLGQKYLTEGNYEEAILAFTAAIKIDPKQPLAYVGRGDAYLGTAELAEDGAAAWESAVADYLAAIDLDGSQADAYYGAAEAYLALGDLDAAKDILDRGRAATGDDGMREWAESLWMAGTETTRVVTLEGAILYNPDAYAEPWAAYRRAQDTSIDTFGIRFTAPARVTLAGRTISVPEALFLGTPDLYEGDDILRVGQYGSEAGDLVGETLRVTGYFFRNSETEELSRIEGSEVYSYRPNGDYVFQVLSWERLG